MKRFITTLLLLILTGGLALAQDAAQPAESPAPDPVEQEYLQLLEMDDKALTKIDEWIRASQRPDASEADSIGLVGKIKAEIEPVRTAYDEFIKKHPNHARAHLTYASFLTDIGEEDQSLPLLIKATEADPKLPAAWNNLANYYGHYGEVKKAFGNYEKAIEIKPDEPVYYHNFGTTVFLFRKDVKEHYNITENEVFDKALALYAKALELDPKNFQLAQDIAQTYYGIRTQDTPTRMARPEAALKAWQYAEQLAPSDFEKQGVYLHQARAYLELDQPEQARQRLDLVTMSVYQDLRNRVGRRVPGYIPPPSQSAENPSDAPTTEEPKK